MKLKLKWWVKELLLILLLVLIIYCLIDTLTRKERHTGIGYDYTCYGNFIFSVCSGTDYDSR